MLTASPEGLKPDERVLDAGCGIGRIAVPLTEYLDESGGYEGFDIAPEGIAWCRENITPRYPNFRFQVADIYNKSYNPEGSQKADEYEFPYEGRLLRLRVPRLRVYAPPAAGHWRTTWPSSGGS